MSRFTVMVCAGCLAIAAVACGGSSPSSSSTIAKSVGTMQVADFGSSVDAIALQLAQSLNYFADQGLNVTIIKTQSSAQTDQAVLTGAADLGLVSITDPAKVTQNGVDAKVVMSGTTGPLNSIVVQADMNVKRGDVTVLRGKTIGVPGLGGGGDLNLRYWLKSGGLDPVKDVHIVNVGGGGQGLIAAMQTRKVDAILSFEPFTSVLVNQLKVGKYLLNPVDGDGPALMHPGHLPWNAVFGLNSYISSHAAQVHAFVRAMSKAIMLERTDPAKTLPGMVELYPTLDQNQVLVPMSKQAAKVVDSSFPASDMDDVNTWLHEIGVLPTDKTYTYQQFVASQFAPDWTKAA